MDLGLWWDLYFATTCLLLSLASISTLAYRGVETRIRDRIFILAIISFSAIYNIYYVNIGDFFYLCKILYIVPFLINIALVDAISKWVYDSDLLGASLIIESLLFIEVIEILLWGGNNVDKIATLIYNNIMGALLLGGLSYAIYRISGGIGLGDVLVFAIVGSMGGLADGLIVFFLSFISGGLYCIIILINTGKKDGLIAFTPFISIGFIMTYEIIKLV